MYYIGNLEFAKLTPGEAHFYDLNGDEIEKQTTEIKWDAEAAEKGGFEHFMMKEIHEQPKAVQDTLNSVIKDGAIDLSSVEITEEEIKNFEQIYIVACGSAWHVGMAAQYVLEDMADVPVRVELASEFRYRKMPLNQKALVIVVSQSGETADTLAALRLAKEKGITTMAIVNVVGSSIAREADKVFYTLAGPEISVATTKAYSAQLAAIYSLAVQFAKVRGKITEEQYSYYISELLTLPEKMQKALEDKERIQWFAAKYANAHDVFFVGRGIDYAVCLEGSLKLKEISYIHPLGRRNLRRVQPALCHLIDFITVQHQVGCESVMLVKKDVLVLNGQKLVQGMQVHEQLMLQIMPQRIAAHHLLRLFVQLAIDKNQWLIKIERKQTQHIFNAGCFTDVQAATARDLFDVASSGILDKFVGGLVNKCRIHNVISFRG